MSNATYRAYIEETKALVKSIVIKSSLAAREINKELALQGYSINWESPETWKYYLNLAGTRHASDDDITITSLDTMEVIPFTHDVLSQHRATLAEYILRGEYYNLLIKNHPTCKGYIDGVLNPVNIDTAINAREHSILTYNKDLLEEQESQLIPALQERIIRFFDVYTVEGYTDTDELYLSILMTQAYVNIMMDIIALRLKACHTENTHSFHIWAYLSGYFSLDDFKNVLSIDQALYLYRNIRTISETTYSTETFSELVEVFLTARSIPLYSYNLNHNVGDIAATGEVIVEHEKILLNFNSGLDKADSRRTVREVLLDSLSSALGNRVSLDLDEDEVTATVKEGLTSRYTTKLLEADITDTSLTEGYALIELTYTEWLRLSSDGRYRLRTTVPNPSGGGAVTLSAIEAFTLLIYLSHRSLELDITDIPILTDFSALRTTPPTLEILKRGEVGLTGYDDTLTEMRDFPPSGSIISSIIFREYVESFKAHLLRCKQITYNEGGLDENIALESVFSKFFFPRTYKLAQETTFEEWLSVRGLDLLDVSVDVAQGLSTVILEKFTGGADYDGSKLYRAHKAMLDIVERLSHHDLQFIRNVNDQPSLTALSKGIRLGNPKFKVRENVIIHTDIIDVWNEGVTNHASHVTYASGDILEVSGKSKLTVSLNEGASIHVDLTVNNETIFDISKPFFEVIES